MVFWVKQLWATSNGATRIFGSGGPENGFFGRILLRHAGFQICPSIQALLAWDFEQNPDFAWDFEQNPHF